MSGVFSRFPPRVPYTATLRSALRRLDKLVDWERRTRVRGSQRLMRVDNTPAKTLLEALDAPQRSFRAVHVTGSKGKGSVSALIAGGLSASGCRTGIYASPHVERVTERVRIDGVCIEDDALAEALDTVLDVREAQNVADATWFDVVCVAGMLALKKAHVDWAVVEVGLGGRLDSTNVLGAPVTVVTNIALEHQDIIGPTLRDIAHEKAGIIWKDSQPIIGMSSSDDLADVFRSQADAAGANVPVFVAPEPGASIALQNVALARRALQFALPEADVEGLLPDRVAFTILASLPGRMERFRVSVSDVAGSSRDGSAEGRPGPEIVDVTLDGAHVAESVGRVLKDVRARDPRPAVVLLALGKDKNARAICQELFSMSPEQVIVTAVSADDPYMPIPELFRAASEAGAMKVATAACPADGLAAAVREASKSNTHVIVIGSLHLAGAVRPMLVALSDIRKEQSKAA